ncbi:MULTISPECIES: hypothetical protein [unclassified Streptomyces]|uniref:hypothetical protein n=1 Tax=unclassified Streptomyces TaxID=2593676 RepID=UPI00403D3DE7
MTHPAPDPVRLADEITCQLGRLTERLTQLPSEQSTFVLGGITSLMIAGSQFAKAQAEYGQLPAEICLGLGRAANELNDIGLDLDEHRAALHHISQQPTPTAAKPPAPAPLIVRRHR